MCQFKNCLIGFALSRSICDAILQLLWSSVVSIPCWLGLLKEKCYILSYIHSLFITLVTCAITIFWDNHQGNRNVDTSDLPHSDKFSQILNVCHNQSIFLTACILTRKTALTIYLFSFYVWVYELMCMYVQVCEGPVDDGRRCWISWSWRHNHLGAPTMDA